MFIHVAVSHSATSCILLEGVNGMCFKQPGLIILLPVGLGLLTVNSLEFPLSGPAFGNNDRVHSCVSSDDKNKASDRTTHPNFRGEKNICLIIDAHHSKDV